MTILDQDDSSNIRRIVDTMIQNANIGRVQEVFENTDVEDGYSNFELDVKILGEDVQHRAIPYQQISNNEIHVPTAGDKVMVEYRGGERSLPIARNVVYTNEDRPPEGTAGVWRKRIHSGVTASGAGDLYVESQTQYNIDPAEIDPSDEDPQSAWVRIAKKENDQDTENLPINIELFDSPSTNESYVKIELSGGWGLKLDAQSGEFKLLDESGYGIVSDGSGNFTWHHQHIDFEEGTTDSL